MLPAPKLPLILLNVTKVIIIIISPRLKQIVHFLVNMQIILVLEQNYAIITCTRIHFYFISTVILWSKNH